MKRYYFLLLLSFTPVICAQDNVELKLIKKELIKIDKFFGVDRFDYYYYLKNNALEKKLDKKLLSYSNLQLGEIDQVKIFNALKIAVLHKDFNTLVLIDNRLAEISIINFNTIFPYRRITQIAYANESSFWLFNSINLELELFDYETQKTKLKTLPFSQEIISLDSNYNNIFALTKSKFYHFNYTGSLVSSIDHEGYDKFKIGTDFIIFEKDNLLYYKALSTQHIQILPIQKKIIKQFFVMNQTLYIYDGEFLYHYQLLKN